MRKSFGAIGISIVTMFAIAVFSPLRDHFGKVWAAPDKVEKVEVKVDQLAQAVNKQAEANITMARTNQELLFVTKDLRARQDMNEKVQTVQFEAMKELVTTLKKK